VHRFDLALLLIAACGGSSAGRETPPPPDPCDGDQVSECLAEKRRACRDGEVHRLVYDTLPPLTVGPGGLVRVDHVGGRLLGVDSSRWLACFEACPEGGASRVCIPVGLPMHLAWTADPACESRERDAEPWQGRPSRALDLACPDGEVSLRHVPELDRVRRNLVAAGAIDSGNVLARLDGLVVEISAGASVQARLESVEAAGCDAFAPPPGYRVIGDSEAFGALESVASEHAATLAAEIQKVQAAVGIQAVARAKAELLPRFRAEHGEACRARGFDPADDARLEACAAGMRETEAPFRAAVGRETTRLLAERRGELDGLTRKLLITPLCRHYSR
jgi:hypothetical protein